PASTTWLQGRCLPYGDGLAFWALGEVVREWAGILDTDDPSATSEKLTTALAPLEDDDVRRAWFARSAGALVGIEDGGRPLDRDGSTPGRAAAAPADTRHGPPRRRQPAVRAGARAPRRRPDR